MSKMNNIHLRSELGIIIFSIILLGSYATVAQVLLIREFLVIFFGNELCLGIILGTWLMGVALGAAFGARIVAKIKCSQSLLVVSLFTTSILLPLEVVLIRILRHILDIPTGEYIPLPLLLFSSIFLIATFSFAIGFIFPMICKIIQGITRDPAADIGTVYFLESIGSLIGGLVFTFVLVTRSTPISIIMSFDVLILTTIILLLLFPKKERRGPHQNNNRQPIELACNSTNNASTPMADYQRSFMKKTDDFWYKRPTMLLYGLLTSVLLLATVVILIATGGANAIDDYFITERWNSLNPGIELLESIDSRHENIAIGVRDDQYTVFGNGQYNFAFPDDYETSQIAHLVMTQHPDPKNILLIGGGVGGLIREMLKHPINQLHYIELDPALLTIAHKYLPHDERNSLFDNRVTTFHTDGRRFVKQSKGKNVYDLIFVNIPDPSTSFINRFYTLEFFQEINHILNQSGIFVLGITSAVNYMGEEVGNYAGSVYHSLHRVFPNILATPGQENLFFASNTLDTATFDIPTLIKRYTTRNIRSEYFSEYLFYSLLPPGRITSLENELKGNEKYKINSDDKPVTYFYNLMLWDKFSGARLGKTLKWIEGGNVKVFLIPIFLFLLFRYLYVIILKRGVEAQQRFNCVTVIATTGFAGISLEIILIFSFQNIYGYMYEKIGLIISLFMLGLAMGSYSSNRMILTGELMTRLRPATLLQSFQHLFRSPINGWKEIPKTHVSKKTSLSELFWIKRLILLEIIFVFYAVILPAILHQLTLQFFGSEYLFMLFVVITGILTGTEFPISSKLHLHRKEKMGMTAGVIDSADHVGGFIGAILVGVLFVPLFGILGSCLIVMTLKLVSMLLLLHLYSQKKKHSKS